MRLHRFFVGDKLGLRHDFWVHDQPLLHQWRKVLRYQPGQELVLFDGVRHDRLYRLEAISENGAHLQHVTDLERKLPNRDVYLLWSLLKKDKNELIVQKATELGVNHLVPLIADRCERSDLSQNRAERWQRIVIEAAEQCGRSNVPDIRQPLSPAAAISELGESVDMVVCEQGSGAKQLETDPDKPVALLIGPEGGWSDAEKQLYAEHQLKHMHLGSFTLRAETAAILAASMVAPES